MIGIWLRYQIYQGPKFDPSVCSLYKGSDYY